MGGDRIESIKDIIDNIFLSLEQKDYKRLLILGDKLKSIDLKTLNKKEIEFLKNALDEIIKKSKSYQKEILKSIKDKEDLKKYNI